MKRGKHLLAGLAFLLFCGSSGLTNYAARHDLPIRLPPETVDYLRKLAADLGDVKVLVGPQGKPQPPPLGSGVIEDELFIVEHPPEKPDLGQHLLQQAHANVAKLGGLFGWYPFPELQAKRRILIRAAWDQATYDSQFPGTARVPVNLFRSQRDAIPSGTVFAIGEDPNQLPSRRLLAYAVGAVQHKAENGTEIYQGVSNELELALIIGAEKARELMEQLNRAYPR